MAKKSTKATKKSTKASKQAKVEETEAEEPEMQESPEEPQEEAEKLDVKDEEKTVDPDLAQTEEDQLNLQQLVEDIAEVTKNDIDGQAEDLDSEEKAEAEAEDEDEEEAEENEEDEVGEEDEENDEDEEKDDEAVEEGVEGDEGDEGDESSEDLGDLDESGELEDGEAEEGEGEPEGIEGISEAGIATQDGQKAKRDYGNLTEDQVKTNKIEAALFVAARPISVEEIMAKTDLKKKEIEIYIFKLAKEYQGRISAIEIVRVGDDKFSLQIKPEYTEDVKKFASVGF